MYTNQFEEAFSDFIDGSEYERASEYVYALVRAAFAAGWESAGGEPPTDYRLFQVLK